MLDDSAQYCKRNSLLQNKAVTTWPNCVKYEVSHDHCYAMLMWNMNTLSFANCFLIDLLQNPLMLLEMPQGGSVLRIFFQQSLVFGIIVILTKYWWYQRIRDKSCLWQIYDFDKISAVSISSSLIFGIIMIMTNWWYKEWGESKPGWAPSILRKCHCGEGAILPGSCPLSFNVILNLTNGFNTLSTPNIPESHRRGSPRK